MIKLRKITLLFFTIFLSAASQCGQYTLSWYPKEYSSNNIIVMPNNDKFAVYLPDGVWEDNFGNFGNMSCVVSAFTNAKKDISLNGYCEAVDDQNAKFWINMVRNSTFEEAGVGYIEFIEGNGKYEKIVGISCPYAIQWIDNDTRVNRGGGSILKLKCTEEKNMIEKLK